jgi:hypothetical protein
MLERYFFFLDAKNASRDVMAESRGGNEDIQLKEVYARLWENGTDYVGAVRLQSCFSSKQLKIKPKKDNVS